MASTTTRRYTRDQLSARPAVGTRHLEQIGIVGGRDADGKPYQYESAIGQTVGHRWCKAGRIHEFGQRIVVLTLDDIGVTDQLGRRYYRVTSIYGTYSSCRVTPVRDVSGLGEHTPAVGDVLLVRDVDGWCDVRAMVSRDSGEVRGTAD